MGICVDIFNDCSNADEDFGFSIWHLILYFVFCIFFYEQTTQLTPPGSNDFPTNKTDFDEKICVTSLLGVTLKRLRFNIPRRITALLWYCFSTDNPVSLISDFRNFHKMWYVLALEGLDEEWVRAELPSPGLQRPGKGVYQSSILIGQELFSVLSLVTGECLWPLSTLSPPSHDWSVDA